VLDRLVVVVPCTRPFSGAVDPAVVVVFRLIVVGFVAVTGLAR
jgi:hypothetical protein